MAQKKKKTVHPPLKKKRLALSKEFADIENLLDRRMAPVRKAKATATKRMYHAETLGLPPLKMVLVHAENDRANAVAKPRKKRELTPEEAVMKLIEHLTRSK
ncbi:MAG: hypothetical protein AB1649_03635 [Chloroflexota bacterium]